MKSQMKAYHHCFLYWGKKIQFYFQKLEIFAKNVFLMSIFFESFCFLPIHMFDFNKWGLKWKLITTASNIEGKNPICFSKTWNLCKKCIFLHQIFLKIFVSYICSILTNEVSNESLLLLLLILRKKIQFYFSHRWTF